MARYPTFEEYQKRGDYDVGIKRCDELLQKSPDDVQLLTTKFKLLTTRSQEESDAVLEKLVNLPRPVQDLTDLCQIEMAVLESQANLYPAITTAGPLVAKLWDNAIKATSNMNRKLDIVSTRWERAVFDSRIADMQQTLIQLKAIQPKNRVVYMAHAALTQMLSKSNDDLQARLALGLARKAVTERFDDDKGLDCRVPGQIFAAQTSEKDMEGIKERPFKECMQVSNALRKKGEAAVNGAATSSRVPEPADVSANEWLSAEISKLKQQFASLIGSKASQAAIRSFATNATRLFHTATTSLSDGARRSPADACFLALSALVRLWELSSDVQYLLHASFLSEALLRYDEHIHEARLILVYLYMRLGLASLAMRLFESLNVKEVQHDTVGHALFTRLSLLHPHPTQLSKKQSLDPMKRIQRALDVYVRCEEKLAETESSVLHHGQTGMLFDLQELRDNLRQSLTRRIALLEWRRTARLMKNKCDESEAMNGMGPQVIRNWIEPKDNRDFAAAFDYGYNVETVLHGIDSTTPTEAWTLFALVADTAWCIATGQVPPTIDSDRVWNLIIDNAKSKVPDGAASASTFGMTGAEYLAGDLASQTLKMLICVNPPSTQVDEKELQQTISAITSAVQNLNIDTLVSTSDALTECLLDDYAYADILRIAIAACTFTEERAAGVKVQLQQLRDQAKQLFMKLQKHATEQQVKIKAANVRHFMAKDDEVWTALQVIAGKEMDDFCGQVERSAKEGWEGLSKIKLV